MQKKKKVRMEESPFRTKVHKKTIPVRNGLLNNEVAHHARQIDSDDSGDGDFGEYTLNDNVLRETSPDKGV